jgi:hypothetical protein
MWQARRGKEAFDHAISLSGMDISQLSAYYPVSITSRTRRERVSAPMIVSWVYIHHDFLKALLSFLRRLAGPSSPVRVGLTSNKFIGMASKNSCAMTIVNTSFAVRQPTSSFISDDPHSGISSTLSTQVKSTCFPLSLGSSFSCCTRRNLELFSTRTIELISDDMDGKANSVYGSASRFA